MVKESILRMIDAAKVTPVQVTVASDLYTDLGFDSLSFVRLLLDVEEEFYIQFDLMEMEDCLKVGFLIATVEAKLGEAESVYDEETAL